MQRKYDEDNLNKQMQKVDLIERKELLKNNEKKLTARITPILLTCNNASKKIRSCKKKLAHSTDQSWFL